jgi:hypothetical protein
MTYCWCPRCLQTVGQAPRALYGVHSFSSNTPEQAPFFTSLHFTSFCRRFFFSFLLSHSEQSSFLLLHYQSQTIPQHKKRIPRNLQQTSAISLLIAYHSSSDLSLHWAYPTLCVIPESGRKTGAPFQCGINSQTVLLYLNPVRSVGHIRQILSQTQGNRGLRAI